MYPIKPKTLFNHFDDYLAVSQFSESRRKHCLVLYRALQRYGLYRNYEVTFESLNPAILADFERFLRKEHTFFDENRVPTAKYKPIFDQFPECRTPKPRGDNYVKGLLVIMRTFIIWANKTGKTKNNPFKERQIKECVYGTPIYITDEERQLIYKTNLSSDKRLEQQRDIFIFQCMIGCRISRSAISTFLKGYFFSRCSPNRHWVNSHLSGNRNFGLSDFLKIEWTQVILPVRQRLSISIW